MSALNIKIQNNVAFLEINNISAGNSFGLEQANELQKFLNSKECKKIDALVWLTPQKGPFCSGGNLKFYASLKSKAQGLAANRKISLALKKLSQLDKVTIALVEGDCFGGGVELLSCFDFVYATPKSMFGLWQRKISLSFGWGGGARIESILGTKSLIKESLLARSFTAYEAEKTGLIDEVVPQSSLKTKLQDLINRNNKLPKAPISKLKSWSAKSEQKIFESLWLNEEHKAVLQKRKR